MKSANLALGLMKSTAKGAGEFRSPACRPPHSCATEDQERQDARVHIMKEGDGEKSLSLPVKFL